MCGPGPTGRTIAATLLNFRFTYRDGEVEQRRSAIADYRIGFSHDFEKLKGTITLNFFPEGIDPLDPDAVPTEDSPITFEFEGQRVPAPMPRRW